MIWISKMMYLKLTSDFLLCFFSYLWFLNKLNFHSLNIFNDRILREIDFPLFLLESQFYFRWQSVWLKDFSASLAAMGSQWRKEKTTGWDLHERSLRRRQTASICPLVSLLLFAETWHDSWTTTQPWVWKPCTKDGGAERPALDCLH